MNIKNLPKVVFSICALTILAEVALSLWTSLASMIGVEIKFEALMISFKRGTPKVTFIDATPAYINIKKINLTESKYQIIINVYLASNFNEFNL